jgi:hypothetical protein
MKERYMTRLGAYGGRGPGGYGAVSRKGECTYYHRKADQKRQAQVRTCDAERTW